MNYYSSILTPTPGLDGWQAGLTWPDGIVANLAIDLAKEHVSVPCVIPESEIQAFIGALRIRDSQVVLARLLIGVFAAIELMQSRLAGTTDETRLLLIKELALEDKNKRYRHMMDEIVAVLGSGKEVEEWMKGFGSNCMTIDLGERPVLNALRTLQIRVTLPLQGLYPTGAWQRPVSPRLLRSSDGALMQGSAKIFWIFRQYREREHIFPKASRCSSNPKWICLEVKLCCLMYGVLRNFEQTGRLFPANRSEKD